MKENLIYHFRQFFLMSTSKTLTITQTWEIHGV